MSVLRGTFRLSVAVAVIAVLASPALAKNFRWICTYPVAEPGPRSSSNRPASRSWRRS
jgi:hypothetical protein